MVPTWQLKSCWFLILSKFYKYFFKNLAKQKKINLCWNCSGTMIYIVGLLMYMTLYIYIYSYLYIRIGLNDSRKDKVKNTII